jgi:hypothetical protein
MSFITKKAEAIQAPPRPLRRERKATEFFDPCPPEQGSKRKRNEGHAEDEAGYVRVRGSQGGKISGRGGQGRKTPMLESARRGGCVPPTPSWHISLGPT